MHNDGFSFSLGVIVGCLGLMLLIKLLSPFSIQEVRLSKGDNIDIIIVAGSASADLEIKTNNLALAERKEYVKRLSALIFDIKKANSREVEEKK